MTLKLAVAGAGSFATVAGGALVALAQPAISAASTVVAASVVASHRDAVMTIRRIPDRLGSGCRCAGKPAARDAALLRPVLTLGMPLKEKGPGTAAGRRGGPGDIRRPQTLLNRAGIPGPGHRIRVTSVMIGARAAVRNPLATIRPDACHARKSAIYQRETSRQKV